MEPLMGGLLANPPENVRKVIDSLPVSHSPAELALKWIWSHPEVSIVLSGMSNFKQVEENLESARRSGINNLSALEKDVIINVRKKYRSRIAVPCTNCKYCMPCPHGVDIPGNFEIFNLAHLHDDLRDARNRYKIYLSDSERSDRCIACRECEEKCPQKILVSEWMPKVDELLSTAGK
jgi:predicted aldo/keto reductase-like oxidoreductase